MQIYSLTTSGKVKTIKIWTEGAKLISESGQLGGKMTPTVKVCKPMNVGKANATTGAEQALLEMKAKVKKKMDEGYDTKLPKAGSTVVMTDISLDNLPKGFCPSKPDSKCPSKVENGSDTYAQRKLNGNCVILVKTKQKQVFSRGMEDLTATMLQIPEIAAVIDKMDSGDMINSEIRFIVKATGKESTRAVASLVRTKDPEEVLAKYKEFCKVGKFQVCPFDKLFHKTKFIGSTVDYLERFKLLSRYANVPELIFDWKKTIAKAKAEGWEGYVLRVPGKAFVTYTTNGKADRAGCFKYKFMKEGDFVVSEVALGDAGRHASVYARFKLGQYDSTGKLLDCGWAGPGTLKHEELEDYTKSIDSGKMKLPFVVEIEFRDWQEGSLKLEHPVIQRVRFDKKPKECEYEG